MATLLGGTSSVGAVFQKFKLDYCLLQYARQPSILASAIARHVLDALSGHGCDNGWNGRVVANPVLYLEYRWLSQLSAPLSAQLLSVRKLTLIAL